MKPTEYRVAVVGAASLLGKEVVSVLKERAFPVARLVTSLADALEPDLPILDLEEGSVSSLEEIEEEEVGEGDLDFVFLAAPLKARAAAKNGGGQDSFLASAEQLARAARCAVIDLAGSLESEPGGVASVPSLGASSLSMPQGEAGAPCHYVSPHAAAIVLARILRRVAELVPLASAVAQVFGSVSEIGPQAIDELQKQAISLLNFQKAPEKTFGAQLAFNMLPRLGKGKGDSLARLERRIRGQLRDCLDNRAPMPALRLIPVPVFHSLGVSLYVETREPGGAEAIAKALAGGAGPDASRLQLRRANQPAPTQVEATGTSDILIDAVVPDAARPAGAWIWAVADNLRLAATNAVEIAEALSARHPAARESR